MEDEKSVRDRHPTNAQEEERTGGAVRGKGKEQTELFWQERGQTFGLIPVSTVYSTQTHKPPFTHPLRLHFPWTGTQDTHTHTHTYTHSLTHTHTHTHTLCLSH